MGNYHVPFWRAVEEVTPSLTLIILNLALSTTGHVGTWIARDPNASGDLASTVLGASLTSANWIYERRILALVGRGVSKRSIY
jgi:hypothetical protein